MRVAITVSATRRQEKEEKSIVSFLFGARGRRLKLRDARSLQKRIAPRRRKSPSRFSEIVHALFLDAPRANTSIQRNNHSVVNIILYARVAREIRQFARSTWSLVGGSEIITKKKYLFFRSFPMQLLFYLLRRFKPVET